MPTKSSRHDRDHGGGGGGRMKNASLVNIQEASTTGGGGGGKTNKNAHLDHDTSAAAGHHDNHGGGEQQIVVACRIRPLTDEEILERATLIGHKIAEDNMIVLMDPMEDPDDILRANRSRERQFVFDMVFDATSTQQGVYEKTTKSLLPKVLNGYNATVFAYGATGAGKTYTMLGTEEEPGIMFRTLHDLFIEIAKLSDQLVYQVSMSYLEIYNELIRDLLNPSSSFLELREDAKGGVQVAGIREIMATTPQEVMQLLHQGNKERTQEPTKANKTSSRSHAVLQVNIKQSNKVRTHTQEVRLGKLYMIDLAGSERAAQTQNTGKRMVEGAHINRSLLALGNCINALSEKGTSKYVNYRDSKLTRILKDSLGGNSKTVMIAHISPASLHFEESRNTLVYADRAKYIKTKVRRNVIDVSYHISQYHTIIQELANEIAQLKDQRSELESRISYLDPKLVEAHTQHQTKANIEETLKLRESLLQSFKEQIKLRKNILELDNAIMDIDLEADRNRKIIENGVSDVEENGAGGGGGAKSNASVTPQAQRNARNELKVIEGERDDLATRRIKTFKELERLKEQTKKLRDQASKKLTNSEQREILSLLMKNFEFEIRNIEMQAAIFKKDYKLREQDMVILRLEQHQSLCQTLITQQRRLIYENNLFIPSDLDELYKLYKRDINDGQLVKDLSGLRSTPNSSLDSPKPNNNNNNNNNNNGNGHSAFLTQIREENYNKSNNHGPFGHIMSRENRNNLSTISSTSTNDSQTNGNGHGNHAEIIYENVVPQRHLIKTQNRIPNSKPGVGGGGASPGVVVVPPGQVFGAGGGMVTSSSMQYVNSAHFNEDEAKRLTQSIAAVAAQRKASQHHKDLMLELGRNSSFGAANNTQLSPTTSNSPNNRLYNPIKQSTNGHDEAVPNGGKQKKKVKIKEIVQYKLPDEDFHNSSGALDEDQELQRYYRRKNSLDSQFLNTSDSRKGAKNSKKNLRTLGKLEYQSKKNGSMNSNSLSNINGGMANGSNSYASKLHYKPQYQTPSIPNYSNKDLNMSISAMKRQYRIRTNF